MKPTEQNPHSWIDRHEPDPRFPTDPEFVALPALSEQYSLAESTILELALAHPGSCIRSDGNPWVDHGNLDQTLYFHEPTLKSALATKGR